MLTTESLKKFALECGADAVGVAPMERFEGAPPEMDPRYIAPDAKYMIGLIFRIPKGYIRGVEEGTHFYQYPSMGYGGINEVFGPTVLYNLGRFIEDHGYEATVYRNTGGRGSLSDMTGASAREESPELHTHNENQAGRIRRTLDTRPVAPDRPAPDVQMHFRIAAFLCGLGEIGYSKMLLTPEFGPMNRQAFIMTDAELEPDPLYDGPALCNRCMACVRTCPGQCISADETVNVTLAGKDVEWGKIDEWKCFAYYQGANKESNPFLPEDAYREIPDGDQVARGDGRVTAENFAGIDSVIKRYYPNEIGGYNPPKCGGCLRACLNTMQRGKTLSRKSNSLFRKRKPWKISDKESS